MKIILASSFVPFVRGGDRFIVEWLERQLLLHGHEVERIYLPFVEQPQAMFEQMVAYRMIDLSQSADRLIAFRPPAYLLQHPNKVLWFIHHFRVYYDLWESPYRPLPDTPASHAFRRRLMDADTQAIGEAKRIFSNSRTVANRLKQFNGIEAVPLYPPIFEPDRFRCDRYGDEIVCISRIVPHKRQHLLVQAMQHVTSGARLRICGASMSPDYIREIQQFVSKHNLRSRVTIEDRWISETEKVDRLAEALAVAYVPLDEDSYGYPSLEASHARKPILTTTDSGGALELIQHGTNGLVTSPDPKAIAGAIDRLYMDRADTVRLGNNAAERLQTLGVSWNHVIDSLLS